MFCGRYVTNLLYDLQCLSSDMQLTQARTKVLVREGANRHDKLAKWDGGNYRTLEVLPLHGFLMLL